MTEREVIVPLVIAPNESEADMAEKHERVHLELLESAREWDWLAGRTDGDGQDQ